MSDHNVCSIKADIYEFSAAAVASVTRPEHCSRHVAFHTAMFLCLRGSGESLGSCIIYALTDRPRAAP